MNTSKRSIIRLSRYKNSLNKLKALGFVKVFSDNLADAVGVTPSQVRKDFSLFGIPGNRRGGYLIDELLDELRNILGENNEKEVIVIGAGNLGTALIKYEGFKREGIKIIAAFDIDESKIDSKLNVPVFHIEQLANYIKNNKIEIAIISVPDNAAQLLMDEIVAAGIKGVLNFSTVRLRAAEDIIIHNIYLQTELESLIYFVNASKRTSK